tara:strand:- start:284 stop:685 length:402 start_codon:yes stop_codon:yes gene_type:complete
VRIVRTAVFSLSLSLYLSLESHKKTSHTETPGTGGKTSWMITFPSPLIARQFEIYFSLAHPSSNPKKQEESKFSKEQDTIDSNLPQYVVLLSRAKCIKLMSLKNTTFFDSKTGTPSSRALSMLVSQARKIVTI